MNSNFLLIPRRVLNSGLITLFNFIRYNKKRFVKKIWFFMLIIVILFGHYSKKLRRAVS